MTELSGNAQSQQRRGIRGLVSAFTHTREKKKQHEFFLGAAETRKRGNKSRNSLKCKAHSVPLKYHLSENVRKQT